MGCFMEHMEETMLLLQFNSGGLHPTFWTQRKHFRGWKSQPICSMYGIFTYNTGWFLDFFRANVGIHIPYIPAAWFAYGQRDFLDDRGSTTNPRLTKFLWPWLRWWWDFVWPGCALGGLVSRGHLRSPDLISGWWWLEDFFMLNLWLIYG